MNIMKLLFELFIFYLLYKLIFEFIIPVFQATRQMKNKVAGMQQRMQEEEARRSQPEPRREEPVKAGEYIEFEEVK